MKPVIMPQPDDTTCGPTSLHAVYTHYGRSIDLNKLIKDVHALEDGGTLAVSLGIDALKRGFNATVYTYNLKIFDPSWSGLSAEELLQKLSAQLEIKHGKKFTEASQAYIHFLELGGRISFEMLTPALLQSYLKPGLPVLCGLSATYLYQSKREYTKKNNTSCYHDLKGEPMGHFVVLYGMTRKKVKVADPYHNNPLAGKHYYKVDLQRLINAVHLGIVTYDANLLVVIPPQQTAQV